MFYCAVERTVSIQQLLYRDLLGLGFYTYIAPHHPLVVSVSSRNFQYLLSLALILHIIVKETEQSLMVRQNITSE